MLTAINVILGTFEALIRMVQRSASGGMGLEELNMISDRGIDVLGILGDKLNLTKDDEVVAVINNKTIVDDSDTLSFEIALDVSQYQQIEELDGSIN